MRMKLIWYLFLFGILCVAARSGKKGLKRFQRKPVYRSVEDIISTGNEEEPKLSNKIKLFVIKARNNDVSEGRFFSHILLFRQLLQPQYPDHNSNQNYHNNGNNNWPQYIYLNPPTTNLTNINNNTLINNPPPAAAAG